MGNSANKPSPSVNTATTIITIGPISPNMTNGAIFFIQPLKLIFMAFTGSISCNTTNAGANHIVITIGIIARTAIKKISNSTIARPPPISPLLAISEKPPIRPIKIAEITPKGMMTANIATKYNINKITNGKR